MSRSLSIDTMRIVKSTAPMLQESGLAISQRMYERLFEDESIKRLFDHAAQASGEQSQRLASAILAYARNIDNLRALSGAIERIVANHRQTQVQPEHYAKMADALLAAIKDVLGNAVDERVLNAWSEAYWYLADILMAEEARPHAA